MRLTLLIILQILFLSTAISQSVQIQHKVESNTTYRWSLKIKFDKEIEQIRYEDKRGGSEYKADFVTGSDSSFLQVRMVTGIPEQQGVPFQGTVDSMDFSSNQESVSGGSQETGSGKIDDIIIYGHFSSFDRMVIDSIQGTVDEDQYNILYKQLDEVYRSMRWTRKELVLDTPVIKSSETPMLLSSSSYVLSGIQDHRATIDYKDTKSGIARGEEKDRTEIVGTIIYNTALKIIERQSYQKIFTQNITYQDASFVSDSKRTRSYDWRFEKVN